MALGLDLLERVLTQALMTMPVSKACSTYLSCLQLDNCITRDDGGEWSDVRIYIYILSLNCACCHLLITFSFCDLMEKINPLDTCNTL